MFKPKFFLILTIIFILWAYIFNGIPYLAYKSELNISKDNDITLTLYPTKRILKLCKLDEIKNVENHFNTISLITPKIGSKNVSDNQCNKLAIITNTQKINIYPMMRNYDIEKRVKIFIDFINSSQETQTIQFENIDNFFAFIILLTITSVFLMSELRSKQK